MNRSIAFRIIGVLAVIAAVASAQNFNPAKRLAKKTVRRVEARKSSLTTNPTTQSKPLTVEQIVNRTNYVAYYQGADGRAKVKMTIVDKRGHKRQKELIILRRNNPAPKDKKPWLHCDEQNFYVYLLSPPDDNKTTYLVWKHLKKDDDRWLYLPNLDLLKRVAATDKRTSFVGSHFFYEDISGRHTDEDKHVLLKTTKTYYVLRNIPKKPKAVEFAYYDMYILKDSFLPVYIWYYDRNGKKYRTYSVLKWYRDKKFGYITVSRARMTDSNIGGYTDVEYAGVRYNIHLPKKLFTARFLKRPPYRFLK